jgi:hypothetical protein
MLVIRAQKGDDMALARLVKVEKLSDLTQQFHVPLCDLLSDLVERNINGPDASTFSQIAHSLAHDLLNLATLAGRLLWYEGVTPDMNRSPDLVAIAVDTENYLISLRTACDILAVAFAHFCIEPGKRNQVPNSSFRALLFFARDNPNRLRENFRFLPTHFEWFMELRGYRDKIVHKGHYPNIYTQRDFFQFFLMPGGVAELQQLHGGYREEDYDPNKPLFVRVPLLSWLKKLTISVLSLSDELCRAIETEIGIQPSKTHVLDGVYVPALHGLLSYEQPRSGIEIDRAEERRRQISAWHLVKAGDYLSAIERGYPDGYWWHFLMRLCELIEKPARYSSNPQFAQWRVLINWDFVFQIDDRNVAISMRDRVLLQPKWIEGAQQKLREFAHRAQASRATLVARSSKGSNSLPTGMDLSDFLIVESDPLVAAEKVFAKLRGTERSASSALEGELDPPSGSGAR